MYSKGLYLVCIALGVVALTIPAQAGHSPTLGTRTAQLALNLVDMRCPSQFQRLFFMERAQLLGGAGRRHLLEDGGEDEEFFLEDEQDQALGGSRHLLGRPGVGPKMTLKAYRESSRAAAVAKAHEICNGAPDDRGPAVFFPLHLDLDVDNAPQVKAEVPEQGAGAAGALGAMGAAVEAAPAMGEEATGGEEAAEGPAGEEAEEEEEDKKDKKKKKSKHDDDEDEADQVVDTGPSVIMVVVLLMLVGSGVGIAGYKYLNLKASNEAPLSERASNIKKQLTRMQNALENS